MNSSMEGHEQNLSCEFNENLAIKGTVSPMLAYHLDEFQHLLRFRDPKSLHRVDIKYDQIKPMEKIPEGVGTAFSGGVDSSFTLWKHLPQNQINPDYRISHALFIHRFDIFIRDLDRYETLFSIYQEALKEINVELIPLETNIVAIIVPRMMHLNLYTPILGACAHILGNLYKAFFIPSSYDYHQIEGKIYSSDLLSDSFLSTDSMEIIHHGSTFRRAEKIGEISDWKLFQKVIRVCSDRGYFKGRRNCSRCEKCVRTMIPIYALGKMEKFKTFDKPLTRDCEGLWWGKKFTSQGLKYKHDIYLFVKTNNPEYLKWIRAAIVLGRIRIFLIKLLPGFIKKWLQRFGYFIFQMAEKNAFENPEIVELLRSHQ